MNIKSSVNSDIVKQKATYEKDDDVKHTIFNILINTNCSDKYDYSHKQDLIELQFRRCVEYLFSSKNAALLLKPKEADVKREDFLAAIESVELKTQIERAPTTCTLHSHTIVHIKHHTKPYINIQRLNKIVKLYMQKVDSAINPFVKVTFVRSHLYFAMRYVSHGTQNKDI